LNYSALLMEVKFSLEKMDRTVGELMAAFAEKDIERAKMESIRLRYWYKVEKAAQSRNHDD
jgi:hypothetical protein